MSAALTSESPDADPPVHESQDPFRKWTAGTLGMTLLLITLGVLFAAGVAAYIIILIAKTKGPPPETFKLPGMLWVSTAVILISSATMQFALSAARRNAQAALRNSLVATFLLGVIFLISQTAAWYQIAGIETTPEQRFYVVSFWFLTVLHGLHVLGGLIPLAMTTACAFRGGYTPEHHPGVSYTAMYWHFLDVVWLILFGVLALTAVAR